MAEVIPQQQAKQEIDRAFIRILIITMLFTVGAMLFLFSLALMEDLSTLARAPELVWAFICGAPIQDGIALPLLLTMATLALGAGIALTGWHIWQQRRNS